MKVEIFYEEPKPTLDHPDLIENRNIIIEIDRRIVMVKVKLKQ